MCDLHWVSSAGGHHSVHQTMMAFYSEAGERADYQETLSSH
mgnify:CR=1 FL=1